MEPLGARAGSHAGGPVSWGPQVRFGDVTLMHAHFHWKLQSKVTDSCAENACPSGFSPGLAAFESGPGRGQGSPHYQGTPPPPRPAGSAALARHLPHLPHTVASLSTPTRSSRADFASVPTTATGPLLVSGLRVPLCPALRCVLSSNPGGGGGAHAEEGGRLSRYRMCSLGHGRNGEAGSYQRLESLSTTRAC